MTNDYSGVEALIGRYFDGLYHSDAGGLAGVFHPDACIWGGVGREPDRAR